jgi:NADH-quinone oxidoreductase subunit H
MISLLILIINYLIVIVPILLSVAIFTLLERKVIGYIQRRKGPNLVGFLGILQPMADGLKLMIKEPVIPLNSNRLMYISAPIITLLLSLVNWVLIPFDKNVVISDLNIGVLFILGISSLSVYGVIIAG